MNLENAITAARNRDEQNLITEGKYSDSEKVQIGVQPLWFELFKDSYWSNRRLDLAEERLETDLEADTDELNPDEALEYVKENYVTIQIFDSSDSDDAGMDGTGASDNLFDQAVVKDASDASEWLDDTGYFHQHEVREPSELVSQLEDDEVHQSPPQP